MFTLLARLWQEPHRVVLELDRSLYLMTVQFPAGPDPLHKICDGLVEQTQALSSSERDTNQIDTRLPANVTSSDPSLHPSIIELQV